MRILLVNPYYPITETPSPPLGLAFLAAVLEENGHDVRIADYVVHPYGRDRIEDEIRRFQPGMVGVTCVTMTFENAATIVRDVKSVDPEIVTVMGGPHVTFWAGEALNVLPELDIVVLGEGEETVASLARALDDRKDRRGVAGIVFRQGDRIVRNERAPGFADLDGLPVPARHLLPLGRYRALNMPISMTTSRGCPYRCIFCVGRKMVGARVRYRNPARVVDELESIAALGFHQVNIADDLFTANRSHCLSVCDEILRRRLCVGWSSFARVDTVVPELLSRMKAAGCRAVSFGVESANAGILKTVKKGITTPQVEDAVRMCVDNGILPHASFILGLPGETPSTVEESRAFGEKIKAMGASYGFHLLAPFPGTEVRERHAEYGIRILTNEWPMYHANRAIVETQAVKRSDLDRVVEEWEDNLNRWLELLCRRVELGEAAEDDVLQIHNMERTVILHELMMKRSLECMEGVFPEEGKPETESLKPLAAAVTQDTAYPEHKVHRVLFEAARRGDIAPHPSDRGLIRWEWMDYLKIPSAHLG